MVVRSFSSGDAASWGEFVEVAYQMYLDDPANPDPVQPSYFPSGWTVVANLTVDPIFGLFSDVEFIGFIAQSTATPSSYVVVFRGTESDLDWLKDLEFWLVPLPDVANGGRVEEGFLTVYQSLKATSPPTGAVRSIGEFVSGLPAGSNLTISGHSLGAALAILHATYVVSTGVDPNPSLVTFAAPMVGDQQFAATFNAMVAQSVRVYNEPDMVPRLPGTVLGYTQVHTGVEVNSLLHLDIKWSFGCFHSLLVYLFLMGSTRYGLGDCAVGSGATGTRSLGTTRRRSFGRPSGPSDLNTVPPVPGDSGRSGHLAP